MDDWDNDEDAGSTATTSRHPRVTYESKSNNSSFYDEDNGGERGYKRDRENRSNRNGSGSGAGGGGGGRSYDFSEEVDVRSDCVGMIIGRAGANIQRIQSDYNVRLELDKNSNVLKISSNSKSSIRDALEHVKDQMDSSDRGGGGDRRRDRYDGGGGSSGGSRSGGGSSNRYERKDKNDFYTSGSSSSTKRDTVDDDFTSSTGVIDWDKLNKKAENEREKRWAKCPQLTKNFYKEAPEVTNLSDKEIDRIREKNNNTTCSRVFEPKEGQTSDIPNPIWKFEQCFSDYPDLMAEIYKQDFEKPSPIQAQAWPILLSGEDLIGIAQTGTGKTLAFLLPAMIHTEYQTTPRNKRGGPNVLILAPTRELALQIEKEVNKYSFRGMKAVCVYGGGNRREQISDVESGAEIIICTPGRLNDLIQANVIDVASITYLILDEADRMLDMGFEPQIRKVLLDIRPDRQTVMTSATWPPGVRRLAQSYMNNPIQVCVGSLDLAATHTVRQVIEIVDEDDKFYRAKSFIKKMHPDDKIIIFCGKKVRADDLSSDLTLDGYMCQCIHGSRDQSDREQAIADITSGQVRILIATDVASRGLDIEDITHVINFDFPRNIEEYVHRVGRTGRAGRSGTSISYITRSDWGVAKELIEILEEADQEVPETLRDMAKRFSGMKEKRERENNQASREMGGRGGGGGGRDGDWTCSTCNSSNFAFRKECFKCNPSSGRRNGGGGGGGRSRY